MNQTTLISKGRCGKEVLTGKRLPRGFLWNISLPQRPFDIKVDGAITEYQKRCKENLAIRRKIGYTIKKGLQRRREDEKSRISR